MHRGSMATIDPHKMLGVEEHRVTVHFHGGPLDGESRVLTKQFIEARHEVMNKTLKTSGIAGQRYLYLRAIDVNGDYRAVMHKIEDIWGTKTVVVDEDEDEDEDECDEDEAEAEDEANA